MDEILINDFKKISTLIKNVEQLRDTKWLITGSTGMIGSYFLSFIAWLSEEMLDGSISITAVHRSEIDPCHPNVGHLLRNEVVQFYQADITEDFNLIELQSYDYIIHAASNAAPVSYLSDPIGTINANIKATQNLLDKIINAERLKSFVYVSSGEIYGSPSIENIPTPENYLGITDHLSSRSCYVESKKFAETMCYNYHKVYSTPIKIVRPVHVYGPGFRKYDSRVWADFIIKTVNENKIEILGDGLSRRGFCYLADALLQIMNVILYGQSGEAYNIGNDKHISIKELADTIAAVYPKQTEVIIKNQLPEYLMSSPQISCPDIQKTSALGTLLTTSIESGLKNTIQWYENLDESSGGIL